MSRAVLAALQRDCAYLEAAVSVAERAARHFEAITGACSSVKLDTVDEKGLYSFFRRLFRLYLSVTDDAMVLFTGKLCRAYHKAAHQRLYRGEKTESALHCRGKESAYFKHSEEFSRCSVDGLNYESRQADQKQKMSKHEDAITAIIASVDQASDKLQVLMKNVQQAFESVTNELLGSRGLAVEQLSVNLSKHLGESFSFQLPTARSKSVSAAMEKRRKLNGASTHGTVEARSGFSFSREDEVQTLQYREHKDLSQTAVFAAEQIAVLALVPRDAVPVVIDQPRIRPKSRVVLESDEEEDSIDDCYKPKLKLQQPLASDLCIFRDSDHRAVMDTAPSSIHGPGRLGSPNNESIDAIKQSFGGAVVTHLDSVAMEAQVDNPELVYATELPRNVKKAHSLPTAHDGLKNGSPPDAIGGRTVTVPTFTAVEGVGGVPTNGTGLLKAMPPLEPSNHLWKCRLLPLTMPALGDSNFPVNEIEITTEWYTAAVLRKSKGVYQTAPSPDSCFGCSTCRIAVIDVLAACFAVQWKLFFESIDENMPAGDGSCAYIPRGVVSCAGPMLKSGDVIEALALDGESSFLDVNCEPFHSSEVLLEFGRQLKRVESWNRNRLGKRTVIPPFDLVCAVESAVHTYRSGRSTLLQLAGMLSLSVGAKVPWLEFEVGDGSFSPRSLQCVLVLSAVRALNIVSKVGISMNGISVLEDSFVSCMLSCNVLSFKGCNLVWSMIAAALLEFYTDSGPTDHERTEEVPWWCGIDEGIDITHMDLSCNSNLLVIGSDKRIASLWSKFLQLQFVLTDSNGADSKSQYTTLLQMCFDFLLVLPCRLDYVDFSYCFANAIGAASCCEHILTSLRQRGQERKLRPIDCLVVQGVSDYLPKAEVDKFIAEVASLRGAIKVFV